MFVSILCGKYRHNHIRIIVFDDCKMIMEFPVLLVKLLRKLTAKHTKVKFSFQKQIVHVR